MALSNAQKFINLGMPADLAKVLAEAIESSVVDSIAWANVTGSQAGVEAAVAAKTEIAALTSGSDAAAIVAALQA